MSLDVAIRHGIGGFALDVAFTAAPGLTALFGRSGAGKSTVVKAIAGLIKPDFGRISIDGTMLLDTASGVALPVHQRRLGTVFQEPRLFPHLSVRGNLAYGRWFQQTRAPQAEFNRIVDILGLSALLERRPETLSGGEKQRTAIGRALLASPRLLLMDEPLSSLDDDRKHEIMPYLERLRDASGIPIVYVSHSVAEVARLAQTIVLLSEGRVVASGPTSAIMQRLDLFALTGDADAGALIEAVVFGHDDRWHLTILQSRAGRWQVPRIDAEPGTRLRLRIVARDVMVAVTEPGGVSALNVLAGVVAEVGPAHGASVDIRLDCNGEALAARITAASADRLGLRVGMPVFALVKSVAIERRSVGG